MYLLQEIILAALLLGMTIAVPALANNPLAPVCCPSARRAKSEGGDVNTVTRN
jgi:hypothetical protein